MLEDGRGDDAGPGLAALTAPLAPAVWEVPVVCDASVSSCCAMTCKWGMYERHIHAECK